MSADQMDAAEAMQELEQARTETIDQLQLIMLRLRNGPVHGEDHRTLTLRSARLEQRLHAIDLACDALRRH